MSLVITPKSEKDLKENSLDESKIDSKETTNTPNIFTETKPETNQIIKAEEPRVAPHPTNFQEAKNKPSENKLYPPAKRYPGNPTPNNNITEDLRNSDSAKTRYNSSDISRPSPSLNDTNSILDKETDLLRTNIYYTKKLYEEVSDLKRTIKIQGYIKYSVNIIFLLITLVSFYYGVQVMKGVFSGGISELIPSISSSQKLLPDSLQGNLFGQAMKLLNQGDTNIDLGNIVSSTELDVNIINDFLKK